MKEIRSVAILGTGQMGTGIARVTASSGFQTLLLKITPGSVDEARKKLDGSLAKEVKRGKLTEEERQTLLSRVRYTTVVDELADVDLVIESIVEEAAAKQNLLRRIDGLARKEAIFASNTSTLCITELATATGRPERFLGLHFFNPVAAMKLVEVVPTLETAPQAVDAACEFARALGKTPVVVRDATGFVVNRLLTPYLLDAIRAFEGGLASLEHIDQSMQLGCGHPMGPLQLCDFIGLDIVYAMAENLFCEFKDARFAPPPLLRRMVLSGMLGRKRSLGFYDYREEPVKPNPSLQRTSGA